MRSSNVFQVFASKITLLTYRLSTFKFQHSIIAQENAVYLCIFEDFYVRQN